MNNACVLPCEAVKCSINEECVAGNCSCKKNYFRSYDKTCIPIGACKSQKDCKAAEKCESSFCVIDCFAQRSEKLISNCFWDEAIAKKDEGHCSFVEGDDRTRCYFNVSVARKDRKVCDAHVPLVPKTALMEYNKQECVVQVAERKMDYSACENVPKFSFKELEDPDVFCKRRVFEYIEYVNTNVPAEL